MSQSKDRADNWTHLCARDSLYFIFFFCRLTNFNGIETLYNKIYIHSHTHTNLSTFFWNCIKQAVGSKSLWRLFLELEPEILVFWSFHFNSIGFHLLPLLNDCTNLLPLAIKLCFATGFIEAPGFLPFRHLDAILECSFGQSLLVVHILAIFLLGVKVPAA